MNSDADVTRQSWNAIEPWMSATPTQTWMTSEVVGPGDGSSEQQAKNKSGTWF